MDQTLCECRIRAILFPSRLNETEIQVLALYVDPSWMSYSPGWLDRAKARLVTVLDWLSETSRISPNEYQQMLKLGAEYRLNTYKREMDRQYEKDFGQTKADGSCRTNCYADEIRQP